MYWLNYQYKVLKWLVWHHVSTIITNNDLFERRQNWCSLVVGSVCYTGGITAAEEEKILINFFAIFEEKLFFIIFGEIERELVSQIESDLIWMHICSYWEMQFCKRYHVLIAIWINLICYRCFIEHSGSAKIQTFYLNFFQDWLSIFCVHSLHINAPFLILMPISGHTIVLFKSDGWEECINLCQSEEKLDLRKIVAMPLLLVPSSILGKVACLVTYGGWGNCWLLSSVPQA